MRRILSGTAAPEAVGALLMLMRYRTENAEEVAGFVRAMRAGLGAWAGLPAALDWPSYASGRSRGEPWFVLAARLVAGAGVPVLMHGTNAHLKNPATPRAAFAALRLPVVETPEAARATLGSHGFAYVPLEALDRRLSRLIDLRDVLGLRSPVHTCLRALNPAGAMASLQGVFHPPYRELQRDAAERLGQTRVFVVKGGGGEAERHPAKATEVFGLADGRPFDLTLPPVAGAERRRLRDDERAPDLEHLLAIWQGRDSDPFAEAIVTGTAALALLAAGRAAGPEEAEEMAAQLWRDRTA